MFWDLLKDLAIIVLGAVLGWIVLFIVSRTVFIAYFQSKADFVRNMYHYGKEKSSGQAEDE